MTAPRRLSTGLLVTIIAGWFVAGTAFAEKEVTSGAFSQLHRIEHELVRGVSKKADVQRLLGAPSGLGGGVFPPDYEPQEVWYYEDIAIKDIKTDEEGHLRGDLRSQQLLIFFRGEVMSGYAWTTNAGEVVNK